MFLCAQVTWCRVERLIRALKEDHRSSLKVGVCEAFCSLENLYTNDVISVVYQTSYNG